MDLGSIPSTSTSLGAVIAWAAVHGERVQAWNPAQGDSQADGPEAKNREDKREDRMLPYPKIQSVFKRDPDTNYATFLEGQWSLPEFEYLAYLPWVWTEKVDGTNIRIGIRGMTYSVRGRTDKAQLHPELVDHCENIAISAVMSCDLDGLTLYGEGYGAGIQKGGGAYRYDKGFILFDVATDGGLWLQREDVEDIAAAFSIPVVPIVGTGTLKGAIEAVRGRKGAVQSRLKEGLDLSEGLVCRPAVELRTRRGERVITKVKVRDYPDPDTIEPKLPFGKDQT